MLGDERNKLTENYGKLIKVETYRYKHEQLPFKMKYVQLSTTEGYSNDEGLKSQTSAILRNVLLAYGQRLQPLNIDNVDTIVNVVKTFSAL